MTFEIIIEGPRHLLLALDLPPGEAPVTVNRASSLSEESGDRARITMRETDETRLDARLIALADRIGGVEKGAGVPRNTIEIRVRNLAYSEPYTGNGEFAEPFDPVASLTVQPWKPDLGERREPRVIVLDSPHAFGTGKHPTTRLCLRLLEQIAGPEPNSRGLEGLQVLDFGCGTGILAMAAVKMGAAGALGVEIDPDAVRAAKRNVSLNRLSAKMRIREGSWDAAPERFDLILVNVVAGVLFKTAGKIPAHLKRGGRAVVSGFSERQEEEIGRLLEGVGLIVCEKLADQGWCSLLLKEGLSYRNP